MTEEAVAVQDPTEGLEEIVEERTLFAKVYDRGGGRRRMVASQTPIHWQDEDGKFQDIDTTIEDGKVWKCSYEAELLKGAVGYRGTDPKGGPMGIELLADYVEPEIEGNRAVYKDVMKDVDFVIEFYPNGIRANRIVKSAEGERECHYKITRPAGADGKIANMGQDSKGQKAELETVEEPCVAESDDVMQKVFVQKWTGRVAKMDEKTRKREWSDEVEYPVMID